MLFDGELRRVLGLCIGVAGFVGLRPGEARAQSCEPEPEDPAREILQQCLETPGVNTLDDWLRLPECPFVPEIGGTDCLRVFSKECRYDGGVILGRRVRRQCDPAINNCIDYKLGFYVPIELPPKPGGGACGGGDGGRRDDSTSDDAGDSCVDGDSGAACQCSPGNPVNLQSGNMFHEVEDLRIGGYAHDLVFTRYYNTVSDRDRGLGIGWSHSFSSRIHLVGLVPSNPVDQLHLAIVERADGGVFQFTWRPGSLPLRPGQSAALATCDGTPDMPDTMCYTRVVQCPEDKRNLCVIGGTEDWHAQLTWHNPNDFPGSPCEFQLTTPSGEVDCFSRDPLDSSTAHLVSLTDVSTQARIELSRSPTDFQRVEQAHLSLGNSLFAFRQRAPVSIAFSYDLTGHLSAVCPAIDDVAQAAQCVIYDVEPQPTSGQPVLVGVAYAAGSSLAYTYDNSVVPLFPTTLRLATEVDGEQRTLLNLHYSGTDPLVITEQTPRSHIVVTLPAAGNRSVERETTTGERVAASVTVDEHGGYASADPSCGCTQGQTTSFASDDLRVESITDYSGFKREFTWGTVAPFPVPSSSSAFGYPQVVSTLHLEGIPAGPDELPTRAVERSWDNSPIRGSPLDGADVHYPRLVDEIFRTGEGEPRGERRVEYTPFNNPQPFEDDFFYNTYYGFGVGVGRERIRRFEYGATGGLARSRVLGPIDSDPLLETERETRIVRYGEADCPRATTRLNLHRICAIRRFVDATAYLETQLDDYDVQGNPRLMVEPNGSATTWGTDNAGRVTTATFADGSSTETHFDAGGLVQWTRQRSGRFEVMQYDAAGREHSRTLTSEDPRTTTNPSGESVVFSYDSSGRLTSEQQLRADGTVTFERHREYTADGLLSLETLAGAPGSRTVRTYFSSGRLKTETEEISPSGISLFRTRLFTYDQLDRLGTVKVCFSDANGTCFDPRGSARAVFHYDPVLDTVTEVRLERNLDGTSPELEDVVTSYRWDDLGRLLLIDSPDTGVTTFSYNAAGDMLTRKTPERHDFFTYDRLGRTLTHVAMDPFEQDALEVNYTYDQTPDSKGRLSSVDSTRVQRVLSYDVMGRLSKEEATVLGYEVEPHTYTLSYSERGGLLRETTLPSGQVVTASYDPATDRVTRLGLGLNGAIPLLGSVTHDPDGGLRSYVAANGLETNYDRDTAGRVGSITLSEASVPVWRQELTHNADGSIGLFRTVGERTDRLFYDAAGRLDQWIVPDDPSGQSLPGELDVLEYDDAGNRTFASRSQIDINGEPVTSRTNTSILDATGNRLLELLDPVVAGGDTTCEVVPKDTSSTPADDGWHHGHNSGHGHSGSGHHGHGCTRPEHRAHRCEALAHVLEICEQHARKGHGEHGWQKPCDAIARQLARWCEIECPAGTEPVFAVLPANRTPDDLRSDFASLLSRAEGILDNLSAQLDAAAAGNTTLLAQLDRQQASLVNGFLSELDRFIFTYRVDLSRLGAALLSEADVSQALGLLNNTTSLNQALDQATREHLTWARELLAAIRRVDIARLLLGDALDSSSSSSASASGVAALASTAGAAESESDIVYHYDREGRVSAEELFLRDPGQPASEREQMRLECFNYDLLGRLFALEEAPLPPTGDRQCGLGNTFLLGEYLYDDLGRRMASRQLEVAATTRFYIYDHNNQLVAETGPAGDITREYVYLDGRVVAMLTPPPVTPSCSAMPASQAGGYGCLVLLLTLRRRRRVGGNSAAPASRLRIIAGHLAAALAGGALLGANCDPGTAPPPDFVPGIVFVQTDHRGAPMLATDEAANVLWKATYDPFGEIHIDPSSQIVINLRYPGQYESSLERIGSGRTMYYNWNRYYEPQIGRYLQPEPILADPTFVPFLPQLPAALGAYAYADNAPVGLVDPTAYLPSSAGGAGSLSAIAAPGPDAAILAAAAMAAAAAATAFTPDNIKDQWPPFTSVGDPNKFGRCTLARTACNGNCKNSGMAQCLGDVSDRACRGACDMLFQLCLRF